LKERKQLGFGIIGVAHHHSISFATTVLRHPNAKLVGVYDKDEKLAKNFGTKFGIPVYLDLESFLNSDKLDVGIVTSENAAKKELAIELAKHDKHVLCDKPLGINVSESDDVIAAAKRSRVKLQVGYLSRYTPEALEAKKMIQGIGEVKFAIGENRVDVGSVKILSPWLASFRATGGRGALLEHTVHLADLIQWYIGHPLVSVYATKANNLDNSFEVEDNFVILATYSNGAIASMDGSYCRPTSGRVDDLSLRIIGAKKNVNILIQKKALLLTVGEEPSIRQDLIETELSGRYEGIAVWNMIDDLITCIKKNRTPLTSGKDARNVNQLVEYAYRSLNSGYEVKSTDSA